jgi:mannose-6-phosphate isomerase-like protein (cupin superfamily)
MEKTAVDEVTAEPHPMGVNTERRPLSDVLGTEHVAIVHYELKPGEQFSAGLHAHHDQEEVFVVLSGTATFEHGERGESSTTVEGGEAIRFAPGEFQCGRNESDGPVVGLAIAAPGRRHDWDEIESPAPCEECGTVTGHGVRAPDGGMVIYCLDCGAETRVA